MNNLKRSKEELFKEWYSARYDYYKLLYSSYSLTELMTLFDENYKRFSTMWTNVVNNYNKNNSNKIVFEPIDLFDNFRDFADDTQADYLIANLDLDFITEYRAIRDNINDMADDYDIKWCSKERLSLLAEDETINKELYDFLNELKQSVIPPLSFDMIIYKYKNILTYIFNYCLENCNIMLCESILEQYDDFIWEHIDYDLIAKNDYLSILRKLLSKMTELKYDMTELLDDEMADAFIYGDYECELCSDEFEEFRDNYEYDDEE